jgi:hypothetical protein
MNVLKQFDTVSASEEGAWLHLCSPGTDEKVYADDKQKKPLRIKMKGPDSDVWTAFQRKAIKSQGSKKDDRSPEDVALEDSKLFAKLTTAWENMPAEVGERTIENAIKLYINYKDIRMQALRFVMNQENFTQKPPEA